jgi:hypothetical protein
MRLDPAFDRCFRKLYGQPCWSVKPGYGSFITLEFGKPHLKLREPRKPTCDVSTKIHELFARRMVTVHGQWHLWIYCCAWLLYSGRTIIGVSSSANSIPIATSALDGQALTDASFYYRGCRTELTFDLGARLVAQPYDSESEQWMLYEPTGEVLILRADKMFTYHSGSTTPDAARWRPAWRA